MPSVSMFGRAVAGIGLAAGCRQGGETGATDLPPAHEGVVLEVDARPSVGERYEALDLDGDGFLDEAEFRRWWVRRDVVQRWGGSDRHVDETEFPGGLYALWDHGGDGLTEAEWLAGTRAWIPAGVPHGTFRDWNLDAPSDRRVDAGEFAAGARRYGLFASWDQDGDGAIREDELARRFYEAFEIDGEPALTQQEWSLGSGRWKL